MEIGWRHNFRRRAPLETDFERKETRHSTHGGDGIDDVTTPIAFRAVRICLWAEGKLYRQVFE